MSRRTTDADRGKPAGASSSLAAALTAVTQPVWVLDRDGLIRVANPAAAATLGYSDAGELLGRNGHDAVHGDCLDTEPHPSAECPLLRPCTTGETVTSECDRFVRRDGSTLPVSYVAAPLELPDGCGAVVAFNDIETRREADQALTERESRVTEQEDAWRRVATLVARETAPEPVFQAVADEAAALLRCDAAAVVRFEKDETVTTMGIHHMGRPPRKAVALDPDFIVAAVKRTGRAARFDTDDPDAPDMPERVRAEGVRSALASPVVVGGDLWGVIVVGSLRGPLPPGTERLLADFTDLLATAVSNAQAREDLQRLGGGEAGLRGGGGPGGPGGRCGGWRRWSRAMRRRRTSSPPSQGRFEGCSARRRSGWCATGTGSRSSSRALSCTRTLCPSGIATSSTATPRRRGCSAPGDPRASTTTVARLGSLRTPCGSPARAPRSGRRSPSKAACGAP